MPLENHFMSNAVLDSNELRALEGFRLHKKAEAEE
jgi:hypothetical protein